MSRSRPIGPPSGFDLSGRESIATALGVTVAELDRLTKLSDAPPIYHYVGRPIARKRELEAWAAKRRRST